MSTPGAEIDDDLTSCKYLSLDVYQHINTVRQVHIPTKKSTLTQLKSRCILPSKVFAYVQVSTVLQL